MKNHNLAHRQMIAEGKPVCDEGVESSLIENVEGKVYEAPVLVSYGDVRDITLGPTIGQFESGCAGIRRDDGLPCN